MNCLARLPIDKTVTCTSDLWNVTCALDPAFMDRYNININKNKYMDLIWTNKHKIKGIYLKENYLFFWVCLCQWLKISSIKRRDLSFSKIKKTYTPPHTKQKNWYSKPFAGYEVPPVVVIWQTKMVNLFKKINNSQNNLKYHGNNIYYEGEWCESNMCFSKFQIISDPKNHFTCIKLII